MTLTTVRGLFRASGPPVELGVELGQGGEGSVYAVQGQPDLVAKIYSRDVDPEKAAKLKAMCELATPALAKIAAWPQETLHKTEGGQVVGFTMPRVLGTRPIHMLYSPKTRAVEFPQATWAFLAHVALNASKAFSVVHRHGHAVGDVNENNILVDDEGTVKLIDCDSFSVTFQGNSFPCEVGVPIFTPPELQGQSLRGVIRTADHDTFGLAVLNFLLLFMGRHPFAGRFQGQGEKPLEQMIAEQRFAYGARAAHLKVSQPPNTPLIADVGPEVGQLFDAAFSRSRRPSAENWVEAITALKAHLKPCPANRTHFKHEARECQWCSIEQKGIYYFKTVFIFSNGRGSTATLDLTQNSVDQVWKLIEQVSWPGPPPRKPRKVGVATPPAPRVQELLVELERASGGRRMDFRRFLSIILFFCILAWGYFEQPVALVLLMLPLALYGQKQGPIYDKIRKELKQQETGRPAVSKLWGQFDKQWEPQFGAVRRDAFKARLAELERIHKSLKNIHVERGRRVQALKKHKRRYQVEQYLSKIRIRDANIIGLGPANKAILLSNGIETAFDATYSALRMCPGFSKSNVQPLLEWRNRLEKGIKPNDELDQQAEARIEEQLRDFFRTGLQKLNAGLAELHNIQQRTLAAYQGLSAVIANEGNMAAREQGKLEANLAALRAVLR